MRKANTRKSRNAGKNMPLARAVIYARSATAEDANKRLGEQIEACRKFAGERRLQVIAEFKEVGSGSELDRPELSAMRQLIARDSVKTVIVSDLARLSRNSSDFIQLEIELAKRGIHLQIVKPVSK